MSPIPTIKKTAPESPSTSTTTAATNRDNVPSNDENCPGSNLHGASLDTSLSSSPSPYQPPSPSYPAPSPSSDRPIISRSRTESTLGFAQPAIDSEISSSNTFLSVDRQRQQQQQHHHRRHSSRSGLLSSGFGGSGGGSGTSGGNHQNHPHLHHHHTSLGHSSGSSGLPFLRSRSFVNSSLRDTKIPLSYDNIDTIDSSSSNAAYLSPDVVHPSQGTSQSTSGPASSDQLLSPHPDSNRTRNYGSIASFDSSQTRDNSGDRENNHRQSFGASVLRRLGSSTSLSQTHKHSQPVRTFYDDFTTVDWVHETLEEYERKGELYAQRGLRGQMARLFDAAQGWLLITIVAFAFALIAYTIDRCEPVLSDWREGYCSQGYFKDRAQCCKDDADLQCLAWRSWSFSLAGVPLMYMGLTIVLPLLSVVLTLRTRIPAAPFGRGENVYYAGAGSGVAEVKTILSGFIMRKFLGTYTLINKSVSLLLVISSGLAVGKEGPYVHLATCVGNIGCRLFAKFSENEKKRRQILSAAASAGVALAFGSPLGGVLFSLEEVSYYFLPHQLFRIFFCAMISALFLKFLDPYGTGKIVLFEVSYPRDWMFWELAYYIFLGVCGGIYGALFCKFCMWWGAKVGSLRRRFPVYEVLVVALITGLISFANPFTAKPVSELLLDLASTCTADGPSLALCPTDASQIPKILSSLLYAFVIKVFLTSITFGLKVPSGIYVPSMVVGALFGRILALVLEYLDSFEHNSGGGGGVGTGPGIIGSLAYGLTFGSRSDLSSIPFSTVGGTYAMAGAGAFLAGVTRMNVTLAIILFELTGSLNHVLPFSLTILVANWVSNAIEPESLYELLLHRNNFPYLDNRTTRAFDISLLDLVKQSREIIDVSSSYYVNAHTLRNMVRDCQARGEFDGCIPILSNDRKQHLLGVVDVPLLEYSLDKIEQYAMSIGKEFSDLDCWMGEAQEKLTETGATRSSPSPPASVPTSVLSASPVPPPPSSDPAFMPGNNDSDSDSSCLQELESNLSHLCDLSSIINRTPILVDVESPLALVEMMFTQLGARYICVVGDSQFVGILLRKRYIDYCKNHMHS